MYCRLDAYNPILCPNPFILGVSSSLTVGPHRVDYFVSSNGVAPTDLSMPDATYSWLVVLGDAGSGGGGGGGGGSATALPPAWEGATHWGIDAPDDDDQAAWVASGYTAGGSNGTSGYKEKGSSTVLTSVSDLPTIANSANGGGTRFGPEVVDGLPAIHHAIRQGDALRYQGNRSGIVYDSYAIKHGTDHWFAWAFKLGTEWQVADGSGHQDRVSLFDTHQDVATMGNPSGVNWWGDSPAGHELWWYVEKMDKSGPAYLYNAAAAPGQWQRCIIHYRAGSDADGPVFDVWFATGAAPLTKLPRAVDPHTGTVWATTPAFGDPVNYDNGQVDYVKLEMYKWTTGAYGNMPHRHYWTSGLFAGPGVDRLDEAVAALAPYAR